MTAPSSLLVPSWLTARPIAHRGLHSPGRGVAENSPSAALAAIRAGFAIECDVQLSSDGEAFVFHDFTLDRLTALSGRVDARTSRELSAVSLSTGGEPLLPLGAFIALVNGRSPIVCEIKSRFDGDLRLALRTAEIVAGAAGPVALKSFDPRLVSELRRRAAELGIADRPLGLVAMADFRDEDAQIDEPARRSLGALLHWQDADPDFLSFCVDDLPHAAPHFARLAFGRPVMAWTVRSADQAARARAFADQMIFEGEAPLVRDHAPD